jgi:hypothetical protein
VRRRHLDGSRDAQDVMLPRRPMTRTGRLAWILVLLAAQVLAAVGPLAHAGGGWIEVCTVAGIKRLPAEPGPADRHGGDHCPLCRLADSLAGPPAAVVPLPAAAPCGGLTPPLPAPAARATPAHDAPARAPPAAH